MRELTDQELAFLGELIAEAAGYRDVFEGDPQGLDTSWIAQAARQWLEAVHDSGVITPADAPPPEPDPGLAGLLPRPRTRQEIEQRVWDLGDKVWVFDADGLGDSAYDGSRGHPLR